MKPFARIKSPAKPFSKVLGLLAKKPVIIMGYLAEKPFQKLELPFLADRPSFEQFSGCRAEKACVSAEMPGISVEDPFPKTAVSFPPNAGPSGTRLATIPHQTPRAQLPGLKVNHRGQPPPESTSADPPGLWQQPSGVRLQAAIDHWPRSTWSSPGKSSPLPMHARLVRPAASLGPRPPTSTIQFPSAGEPRTSAH